MLVMPRDPKNSSRLGEASQWSLSFNLAPRARTLPPKATHSRLCLSLGRWSIRPHVQRVPPVHVEDADLTVLVPLGDSTGTAGIGSHRSTRAHAKASERIPTHGLVR
jgi:hypothetical protein